MVSPDRLLPSVPSTGAPRGGSSAGRRGGSPSGSRLPGGGAGQGAQPGVQLCIMAISIAALSSVWQVWIVWGVAQALIPSTPALAHN